MSAQLDYLDKKVMELFGTASEQHAAQQQPSGTLFDYISTRPGLDEAASNIKLADTSEYSRDDVIEKALQIIGVAKDQSTQLLRAAVVVIPPELPVSVQADILRASSTIGRLFGVIPHEPMKNPTTTNDEVVLNRLTARPTRSMEYAAKRGRVQYSADGLAILRPHMRTGEHCPALTQGVTTIEGKTDLFAVGWAGFTEIFLRRQGLTRVNSDTTPDKTLTLV